PATQLVTSLAAAPGHSISTFASAQATPEERARLFLGSYGAAFGITAPDQIQVERVLGSDDAGLEYVLFRQIHQGVAVSGGEILIYLRNADVTEVTATTLPDLDALETTPTVTSQEALAAAREVLGKYPDALLSPPRLEIFNRGLFVGKPSPTRLAWFIEATTVDARESLWVDAQLGAVLLQLKQPTAAQERVVENTSDRSAPLPSRASGETTEDNDVNAAEDSAGTIYQYYSERTIPLFNGTSLIASKISGPPVPPPGHALQRLTVAAPEPNQTAGVNTLAVPGFDWSFGCSATSGAMIAAYYDRNGFANMYTGPTNGGVMPLDSSSWPDWQDGYGDWYGQCPLTASHQGLDGRTTRGSMNDYWVGYGNGANDPYVTGGWTAHTWGDAIGDYMKTSQSAYGNTDGSTKFYSWTNPATPLTCAEMAANSISQYDGTYGRKLFYEKKGYQVTDCYNQNTDNNGGGFTFAKYKAEIDAGRPVFLNLAGHSIVGIGYDSAANTVYLHDTWDYGTHTMTWGGAYVGMSLMSVSIVKITAPLAPDFVVTNVVLSPASPSAGGTVSAAVTVKNQGGAAGVPRTLQVWANHQSIEPGCGALGDKSTTLTTSLAAGASQTITVNGLSAGAVGTKTLRVFVDSGCLTAESNEANNQFTKSYTVVAAPTPDFVVTGVVLTPGSPNANATVSAAITVKNQGAAAGIPRTLQVWANQTDNQLCAAVGDKATTLTTSLAAGASKTVTVSGLATGTAGTKTLRAFVDSGCLTTESNDDNNQFTKAYTALPVPLPDFVVTSVVLTPSSPKVNGTFTAKVTVKNQGPGSGNAGYLDVWTNQPASQTCPADGNAYAVIGTLAAGASKAVTVVGLRAGAAGTKTLRTFVDSYCQTAEANDGNNQAVMTYSVVP
uniref:CARDB domain-containing protein n=1 Tax=Lamprocystis purpurea TaxID=61598 RepID=UPI001B7F9267